MSTIHSQNFVQEQDSDIVGDDNFDNDDLVTFQHDSKLINFYYSQLTKYSKRIRDSYLFSDVINSFPQEIRKFQEEYQLLSESVFYFFQFLQQNYNFNDQMNLTYKHCNDLLKISKFLKVRKLSFVINQFIKSRKIEVDFVLQMIQYEVETRKETDDHSFSIEKEIEEVLTTKINECLSNEKFIELPIQIIYRVVSKSSHETINNNKLFEIIMKSISKFHVLFPFLDLQKLSEDQLDNLCEIYSNSDKKTHHYFDYLKCNLNLIQEMGKRKKNLEEINDEHKKKIDELELQIASLQKQFSDSEQINNQLQNQLNNSKELNDEQQNEMNDLKSKISLLHMQSSNTEQLNNQLQNQLKDSNQLINEQQNKMKELENQVSQLQKCIGTFLIKGEISAKVENGLLISAEINLDESNQTIDMSKSKFIISTSGEKLLGKDAYEKGEPITSHHMKTSSYLIKPGTYFVRCLVFASNGISNEIVSNSVTTSGSSLSFDYEGEARKIVVYQGKYKLEVWGAKGGDSTGDGLKGDNYNRWKQSIVQGGLGGYSRGILNLNKKDTFYVYVGGEGRPSESSDGSITKGAFPDGGGTITGHGPNRNTVPGTGGGSTSIRIGTDTNYTRVIVAGGGGGASGDGVQVDPGGFGGGKEGGNCYYNSSLQSQGAGTQTGSTCGLGCGSSRNGDPGQFGLGATGKYNKGDDSGGGGGGGWYGGGSGGRGYHSSCSSGGGGSGWTFTKKSLSEWKSVDEENGSKFVLDSSYYLTEAVCVGGNEEFPIPDGNGTECGHNGNGYAKITPL